MGKKKKGNTNQKRKQKTALKKARRRASQKPVQKKKKVLVTEEMFPDEDLVFWLAHGVNYLLSDYDNGTWKPLFEEIYEGVKLTPEHIARTIVDRYSDSWPDEAKEALSWSVQPRESVYMYFVEILRRLGRKHDKNKAARLACAPHNGIVWGVFKMIREELVKKKEQRGLAK